MSTIKVNAIRSTSGTSDAISLSTTGGVTSINGGTLNPRNLIINGAMTCAQRNNTDGVADSGHQTVDRFHIGVSGADENPTQVQADVASGTTPYNLGFRNSYKITNGNQTSGAGANDTIEYRYYMEAQDLANSGWNYTSASSFITLSFWIKSSVAQNFYGGLRTADGTEQMYPYETGSLTADTWTKITKTIPGHANLQFDNNNGAGLYMYIWAFQGTDRTASGVSLNAWAAYSASAKSPDCTSTWYTTNDATLEITGFQLEVGNTASSFMLEPFPETLAKCQRYFAKTYLYTTKVGSTSDLGSIFGRNYSDSNKTRNAVSWRFPVTMRDTPTVVKCYAPHSGTVAKVSTDGSNPPACDTEANWVGFDMIGDGGFSGLHTGNIGASDFVGGHFTFEAEL